MSQAQTLLNFNEYYGKNTLWRSIILKLSFSRLLENAKQLSTDYKNQAKPGSNLLDLLIALKNGDINFFNKIKIS